MIYRMEHPAVTEAAVVGVEVEGLTRLKELVDDLPRTAAGKVQRFELPG